MLEKILSANNPFIFIRIIIKFYKKRIQPGYLLPYNLSFECICGYWKLYCFKFMQKNDQIRLPNEPLNLSGFLLNAHIGFKRVEVYFIMPAI